MVKRVDLRPGTVIQCEVMPDGRRVLAFYTADEFRDLVTRGEATPPAQWQTQIDETPELGDN